MGVPGQNPTKNQDTKGSMKQFTSSRLFFDQSWTGCTESRQVRSFLGRSNLMKTRKKSELDGKVKGSKFKARKS